ncbi:MAG TPA: WYL domain-containing transcriptional regulator [Candidatus Limnocylindrales bacterium]|nr:WYL domain-containing transcriptional regulator [Candidatus Limnocylindrales bacterium]
MSHEKLKSRIQRCVGILTTIWSRKAVNRNVLAKRYHCSTRMISEDLALLREVGFPIKYEKGGYTLSLAELQIPPLPLSEEQILALFIGSQLMVLSPLEGHAGEAVNTLLSVFPEETRTYLRNLTDRICIAPGAGVGDAEIIFNLYRAVSECRSIRIKYQALSTRQEEIHDVDPYGIYIKDRASSYMVGYSYGAYQTLRRFKICRIQELEFRGLRFTYPKDFSIRREMAHGFWSGDREYQVLIRFAPSIVQLVKEREPAERIEMQPDGSAYVRKTVKNLKEVLWDILRYEADAEVLEPEELREMVKASIERMRRVYANDG